ncbi:hypothetical protein VNO80_11334 [Phaseolus coccineus]|uniref:Late embryogenesis abundant protein LEA-2 subgroup domain-containing protein n=1 Tax=Phaseolus coccineus TaxID=3886 RepID=A0AAN9NF41_PHACN
MSRRETNPHFSRSSQPEYVIDDDKEHPFGPRQKRRGQPSTLVPAPIPDALRPENEDRVPLRSRPRHEDHVLSEDHPPILQEPRHAKSKRSPSKYPTNQGLRPVKSSKVNFQEPPPSADVPPPLPPSDHPPERRQQPWPKPLRDSRPNGIKLPEEQKSQPLTWLGACLCVIFWLIIIIGGLIVLIVYFVFRPQSPHFDVSSVTLNAAYLDLGYLLNADLTMLANFTNPNKKVHVDFSSVIIYLYYGSTLIATQYVEPFSAARLQSRFATIHMVSSQVQLPLRESQRLVKQMEGNGVILEVRGVFRARSKLGSILRYSYNLYGRCSVMLTRPPNGILLKKKCRTKR